MNSKPEGDLVEHVFRHQYGKLVALLMRKTSVDAIDAVEDAVQFALAQALEFWPRKGQPRQPSAWLYTVASRHLWSTMRQTQRQQSLLEQSVLPFFELEETSPEVAFKGEMEDAFVNTLFMACDNKMPLESQLVFTLKALCGFSISEIADRLFLTPANVYKRYGRAKAWLQRETLVFEQLAEGEKLLRRASVVKVIYIMFTEGYLSNHPEQAIREDLCREAIYLGKTLSESSLGNHPEVYALRALMYFNFARFAGRQDDTGRLVLLEQQDRLQWDQTMIAEGVKYLAHSAQGDKPSRYHLEANIAAEHCLASSFADTHWEHIVNTYELLSRVAPSPMQSINHALAVAEWQDANAGLAILAAAKIPPLMEKTYYWDLVWADLLLRAGNVAQSQQHAEKALARAPSALIRASIQQRLASYDVPRNGRLPK